MLRDIINKIRMITNVTLVYTGIYIGLFGAYLLITQLLNNQTLFILIAIWWVIMCYLIFVALPNELKTEFSGKMSDRLRWRKYIK